jgi:2-polyprenyl-3-methyl-5-hydroxy-6-metoxy-1,4-benzoquinol methylase
MKLIPLRSVCDVGCGDGSWLRAFREAGVTDVLGIDGEYVHEHPLQIPVANFKTMDLNEEISLDRPFDLAISLEVAEHLSEDRATSFVRDLTRLARLILFSAAIPGQGGTNHINEQWQTYRTALFAQCDYVLCDVPRPQIWRNRRIAYFHRQNMLLFCARAALEAAPLLATCPHSLRHSLVHPEILEFGDALRALRAPAPRSAKRRLKQFLRR